MKTSNDVHDLSIQNLLSMELDESVVKRCIDQAKSPLQTLHFDRTSASQGFERNNQSTKTNWLAEDARQRVSSFMITDTFEQGSLPNIVAPHRKREQSEVGRSRSRNRKPIFSESASRFSNFWPQLYTALGSLFQKPETKSAYKPASIPPAYRSSMPRSPEKEQQQSVYRVPNIADRLNRPLSPVSPLQESLRYENRQIPRHEHQFIVFLLKILPKLCLKQSISERIYASKHQLLQTIANKLEHEHKDTVLRSLFGDQNIRRIDRRLQSSNLAEFLTRLTSMSKSQPKQRQQQHILNSVERVMNLLCEVEDIVHSYLSIGNRIPQLEAVFEAMHSINGLPQTLLVALQTYLQRNGIICTAGDLSPLTYLWRSLSHRAYSKQQFVSELIRNDYLIKPASKQQDLQAQLTRMGFHRNA